MNQSTAIDELITDLENSISNLKREDSFFQKEGLTQSRNTYGWLLNAYNTALTTANELKNQLTKIERGF